MRGAKGPAQDLRKRKNLCMCVYMVILCVCALFNCEIYDDQDIFKIMKQIVFYVCVYVQRQRSHHYKYLDPRALCMPLCRAEQYYRPNLSPPLCTSLRAWCRVMGFFIR